MRVCVTQLPDRLVVRVLHNNVPHERLDLLFDGRCMLFRNKYGKGETFTDTEMMITSVLTKSESQATMGSLQGAENSWPHKHNTDGHEQTNAYERASERAMAVCHDLCALLVRELAECDVVHDDLLHLALVSRETSAAVVPMLPWCRFVRRFGLVQEHKMFQAGVDYDVEALRWNQRVAQFVDTFTGAPSSTDAIPFDVADITCALQFKLPPLVWEVILWCAKLASEGVKSSDSDRWYYLVARVDVTPDRLTLLVYNNLLLPRLEVLPSGQCLLYSDKYGGCDTFPNAEAMIMNYSG